MANLLQASACVTSDRRGSFGRRGEDLACAELRRRGYAILERRFRTRMGEIDIIARDGDVVVFVEVRARSDGTFGTPFDSITWQKRHRLSLVAAQYALTHRLAATPCRFDIVAVTERRATAPVIEVIQGAFDVGE